MLIDIDDEALEGVAAESGTTTKVARCGRVADLVQRTQRRQH
jgi:hypothetical protein